MTQCPCCDNMVVRCMDFRFHAELPRLLAEHFGVECFEYDSPGGGCGGSKSFIDPDCRKIVLHALDLAVSLHSVKRLVIVDHMDCGAYGGSERFGDLEVERQFHVERLQEAREIVREHHPQLETVLFIQDGDGIALVE
jgi:hypothetical protein